MESTRRHTVTLISLTGLVIGAASTSVASAAPHDRPLPRHTGAASTPRVSPDPSYELFLLDAFDDKDCYPTALTDAGYVAASCGKEARVVRDNKIVALKTDAPEAKIDAFHVTTGNRAGMLAGPGKCTAKSEGASSEPCVVRWDAKGEPSTMMLRDAGDEEALGAAVPSMNAGGDVALTEIHTKGGQTRFLPRLWWVEGSARDIKPQRPDGQVLIHVVTDSRMAIGVEVDGSQPTPTASSPLNATRMVPRASDVVAPGEFTAPFSHLYRTLTEDTRGRTNAVTWSGEAETVTALKGVNGKIDVNLLADASPDGQHLIGTSGGLPVRFALGTDATPLPAVSGDSTWEPHRVNNSGMIVGAYADANRRSFITKNGVDAVELAPESVGGMDAKDKLFPEMIDSRGALLALYHDQAEKRHIVLLNPKSK